MTDLGPRSPQSSGKSRELQGDMADVSVGADVWAGEARGAAEDTEAQNLPRFQARLAEWKVNHEV